jgi:hypothetical protein
MANKKTIKRILIEKRTLSFLSTKLGIPYITVLDLVKELKEFSDYKYLKRTIWTVFKSLMVQGILEKNGDKEFGADCYRVVDHNSLLIRLKDLENKPILVKKQTIQLVETNNKIALTSSDVGKNIISYVNEVEEKYYDSLKRIESLEKKIKLLEREVLDYKASLKPSKAIKKMPAGSKMFIFDNIK